FWFRDDAPNRLKPAPGEVTIMNDAAHSCDRLCAHRFRGLQRFAAEFAGQPLRQLNLTQTYGFYRDTAPVAPEAEARNDSVHFFGQIRVPGALAVYDTHYQIAPDGRRRNQPTPQEAHYPRATLMIVDKRGMIRYVMAEYEANYLWDQFEGPLAVLI